MALKTPDLSPRQKSQANASCSTEVTEPLHAVRDHEEVRGIRLSGIVAAGTLTGTEQTQHYVILATHICYQFGFNPCPTLFVIRSTEIAGSVGAIVSYMTHLPLFWCEFTRCSCCKVRATICTFCIMTIASTILGDV